MSLKKIDKTIKNNYTIGWDDVVSKFFIPCIEHSIEFDYITGYFSSKLLVPLFNGIKTFVLRNSGAIKLIVGVPTSSDINIFNMSKNELKQYIKDELSDDFLKNDREGPVEHKKLLAWLLFHNKIEIKWALPIQQIDFLKKDDAYTGYLRSILHEKIGIFSDGENYLTFSGSSNMTYMGWIGNRESIKVFKSWDSGKSYAEDDYRKFNYYWNEDDHTLQMIDFPTSVKSQIIKKYKPDTIEDVDFEKMDDVFDREFRKKFINQVHHDLSARYAWIYPEGLVKRQIEIHRPYSYQEKAIQYLRNTNFNGFLAMATGTGKTKTSIFASYELYKKIDKKQKTLLIIVGVPDSYLVKQWGDELSMYTKNVLRCHSENPGWKDKLNIIIKALIHQQFFHYYLVGTYRSLRPKILNKLVSSNGFNKRCESLFIADEAHTLGSPGNLEILQYFSPDHRIGLSATPERYFDEEGTKSILTYFLTNNQKPFELDLKSAQELNAICEFLLDYKLCALTKSEFKEYCELTEKIRKSRNKNDANRDNQNNQPSYLEMLLLNRAKILKKATNKNRIVKEILDKLHQENELYKTVLYCQDTEQRNQIVDIISEVNLKYPHNQIRYNNIDGSQENPERERCFKYLKEEKTNLITAMKCLDQGVDIPVLQRAIFIASSGSPLEHIQRAGRILRKNKDKHEPVNIIDIIIKPTEYQYAKDSNAARSIMNKEKKRLQFFAQYAKNRLDIETDLFLNY